jgi:HK97 family phage portal protein
MATRRDATRRLAGSRGVSPRTARLARPREYSWLLDGTPPAGEVYPATEWEAMGLPPFGRSVVILASAIAGTPWHAETWDADRGISQRIADQPAVLVDPFPDQSQWAYRWGATEDGILYGNHFALMGDIDFRTNRPGWVVPVPADQVWIGQDPANPWDYWWTIAGETFTRDEVLHVPYGARSGEVLGRGVLAQYGQWLGGPVAAERHAANYFAGGALPPAVLSAPVPITQTQADELKGKWFALTATREPMVLPAGYTLTPVVSNAEQAQLVESRTWDATMVSQIVGVPYWMLGLQGPSMTYLNVEGSDIAFVRDYADRWAQPLSAAYSKWMMPRGTSVAWDWTSRMRSDSASTAGVLKTLTDAGIVTKDEARAVLGRPPLTDTTAPGSTPAGVPELTPGSVAQ